MKKQSSGVAKSSKYKAFLPLLIPVIALVLLTTLLLSTKNNISDYVSSLFAPAEVIPSKGGIVTTFSKPSNDTTSTTKVEAEKPTTVQSNQSSGAANTKPAYTPGVCAATVTIPYKTVYKYVSWLSVGETQFSSGGINGFTRKCTKDSWGADYSSYTIEPTDAVYYAGTTPNSTSTTTAGSGYTYSQAYNLAVSNCGFTANTSAYQPCIDAYLHQYGY